MISDRISLDTSDVIIINRKEFEDNYHQLQGSCMAFFRLVMKTYDRSLICQMFEWQLRLFHLLPTEMDKANANLMFVFLGSSIKTKKNADNIRWKILYCLKEENCDESIVDWFEAGGKDTCYSMTEDEWFQTILKVMSTDSRSCEQINESLAKGSGTDYDRIAIRVKAILKGHEGGDNLTFVIRRVMERLGIN